MLYYVTTKPTYAAAYAKDDAEVYHYLTQYNLKEKISIFNMRYKKDVEKLKDFLRTHNLLSMMSFLKYLKEEDWLNVLKPSERNIFIEILKNLNYDGFFNIERTDGYIQREDMGFEPKKDKTDLYGFSGIGLFNQNSLIFNKQYYGWDQIKNVESIQEERNTQYNYLKTYLVNTFNPEKEIDVENLYFRFFLLRKNEIDKIVDSFDYEKEKKLQKEISKLSNVARLRRLKEKNQKKSIIVRYYTEDQLFEKLQSLEKAVSRRIDRNKKLMERISKLEDQ